MVKVPTLHTISIKTLKAFFKAIGYHVRVHSGKGQVKRFEVMFDDNQPITDELYKKLHADFPEYRSFIRTYSMTLSRKEFTEVLPVFVGAKPSVQVAEKPLESQTSNGEVNTPKRRSKEKAIAENKLALELLHTPDFETRILTEDEKRILENYAGVGGQYTDDATSQHNEDALTQFYTPAFAGERIYEIAYSFGFPKDGKILEPSCGVGRLIKPAPHYENVTAFEVSEIPCRMARKLYPGAHIHHLYFEQAFLQQPRYNTPIKGGKSWLEPFDLVIGNPPYGKHSNMYQSYLGKPNFAQIEHFFLYYGLKLLKPGGLLMYVTNTSFLRTGGTYEAAKAQIFSLAKFEYAYEMPTHFMELTDVSSMIIIFRRK